MVKTDIRRLYTNSGFLITSAVLVLSVCFVIPGLFDTTLTSRLAVYPVLAGILLLTGRKTIPVGYFYAGILIALTPLISSLWTAIPLQGIVPCVRWFSFGAMIIGGVGIIKRYGIEPVFRGLVLTAVIATFLMFVMNNNLPAGNPNRLGPLFAAGLLAATAGIGFKDIIIRVTAGLIIAVGLYLTSFYTAWIALLLGIIWLLISRRWRIHPVFMLCILLSGQIVITVLPNLAGEVYPTLELRSRTWSGGLKQLEKSLPLGTGVGQSRLTLLQDTGEEAQLLIGDPDTRIDFLHSEFLTPVVEMGIPGLLALLMIGWFLLKRNFSLWAGAFFVCALPFLLVDLPLATPLGAIPIVFCLVSAAGSFGKRSTVNIPAVLPIVVLAAGLLWAGAVIHGYHLMEKGRITAIAGDPGAASELFEKSNKLIPFEERNLLLLGASRMEQGAVLASREAYSDFNSLYPGYWRGWKRLAEAGGNSENAASAWFMALRTSPVTLPERCILAVNAASILPDDLEDCLFLAASLKGLCDFVPLGNKEIASVWAYRLLDLSVRFIDEYPGEAGDLLMEAGNCLYAVSASDSAYYPLLSIARKLPNDKCLNFFTAVE